MVALVFDATAYPLPRQIAITVGRSKIDMRWTDRRILSFDDLWELLRQSVPGRKDGACYTPAIFTGAMRRMDQAQQIDVVVLDSDCGHTMEEIQGVLRAKGWAAIIHSTYSHLSEQTAIAAGPYDKWLTANEGGSVGQYMAEKEGYLPRVMDGAEIVDEIPDGKGSSYVVKHRPCPKYRIVMPLAEPWIAANYQSQNLANAAWKERIGALAYALRLYHDQSCVDTSRLFYFPRHREGAGDLFEAERLEGLECPLWSLPDAVSRDNEPTLFAARQPSKPTLVAQEHKNYQAPDGRFIDLTSWAAEYAGRFEVVAALRARSPGVLARRVSGVKQHLVCPNVGSHTTGSRDHTGTYAVNASEIAAAGLPSINSGFVINCVHNGCAGHDRLDHLRQFLRDGTLTIQDLTDPAFLVPDVPRVDATALINGTGKKFDPAEHNREDKFPASLHMGLPGVMKDMHAYIGLTSPKPQPILNLGAMLAFMGAVIGRKVVLQHWGTRPNVYALGIAYSGAGKERSLSACKDMARASGLLPELIGIEDITSDTGIITAVCEQPAQVMLLDEMSYLINSANNAKAGPHTVNVISTLMKLYSSSHTTYKGKAYADSSKLRMVDQPCVSLFGCCTPDGLFSALTSRDVNSGLLSRMVLFNAGDHDPLGKAPAQMDVPQRIIDWLRAWHDVSPMPNPVARLGGEPKLEPITVLMTQEAMDLANAFEVEMHEAKIVARASGTDALYVRARENALKFALIRACSVPAIKGEHGFIVDKSALRVDADTMRWAVDLSRATLAGMVQGAKDKIADTPFEVKLTKLRELIRKAGPNGATTREMRRMSAGRLPQRELDEVLRTLGDAGEVVFVEDVYGDDGGDLKRGKKRNAYVHADYVNNAEEE